MICISEDLQLEDAAGPALPNGLAHVPRARSWRTSCKCLAHSTPPEFLFSATDFNSYVTRSIAEGAPRRVMGRARASDQPGLGIKPRFEVLGKPVLEIR